MEGYLSVDLETTALTPARGQILEFAAVFDDFKTPVESLPRFTRIVLNKDGLYRGEPIALAMNALLISEIAEIEKSKSSYTVNTLDWCYTEDLGRLVAHWLGCIGVGWTGERVTYAGKNFGTFDRDFLQDIGFFSHVGLTHRVIDPGSIYWNPTKDGFKLPNTNVCKQRAGFEGAVSHRALDDALDVVKIIRAAHGVPCSQLSLAAA